MKSIRSDMSTILKDSDSETRIGNSIYFHFHGISEHLIFHSLVLI